MCLKTLCAQERARAKRKGIFELRAATIIKNSPQINWHDFFVTRYYKHSDLVLRSVGFS